MLRFIRGCPCAQSLWKEEIEAGPAEGEARPPCSLSGNSANFTGSSEGKTAIYYCPNMGRGDQAVIARPGSVIGCVLPCKAMALGKAVFC